MEIPSLPPTICQGNRFTLLKLLTILSNERKKEYERSIDISALLTLVTFPFTLSAPEHFLCELFHLRCFYDPGSHSNQQSWTHPHFRHPCSLSGVDVSSSSSGPCSGMHIVDAHRY